MYIEEVILDGFKSYATRTCISGFDRSFNAVTGLNGSGKSNILDAICFVLGITNLSQVRVNGLQELVYKQGQSGVSKASVTIVFNNSDPKSSPVGYEQFERLTVTRQVVIGGRNKYLLNGHNAPANRVHNLFHSVQLNVNNPHFLIMQGKITQVIKMRPLEVLGLLEEAAGTRMFESKKQSAQKTIQKKEKKVQEMVKVLEEEITPTLEKLKAERSDYVRFTNNQAEISRLTRFTVAFEYCKARDNLQNSTNIDPKVAEKERLENNLRKLKDELVQIKAELGKAAAKKEKEMGVGCKELESEVSRLSRLLVKATSAVKHTEEGLEEEQGLVAKLEANLVQVKKSKETNTKKLEAAECEWEKVESKAKSAAQLVEELEARFQALSTGVGQEGQGGPAHQLMEAQRLASEAASEAATTKMKLAHSQKIVDQGPPKADREYVKLQKEYQELEDEIHPLEQAVEQRDTIQKQLKEKEKVVAQLEKEHTHLKSQVASLEFTYSDPEKGFDHRRVKGLVVALLKVKDPSDCIAIEVAAGGKLYNVVVDNENTGKLLLKKGKLKRRITIVPLTKIRGSSGREPDVDGGKPATSAVEWAGSKQDKDGGQRMIEWAVGGTVVCSSGAGAKGAAFKAGVRGVTKEGDLFDPRGTLTGGARPPPDSSLFARLSALTVLEEKLSVAQHEANSLRKELDRVNQAPQTLRLHHTRLSLLTKSVENHPQHHLHHSYQDALNKLSTLQDHLDQLLESEKSAKETCLRLQKQIDSHGQEEVEFESLNAQIGDARTRRQQSRTKAKKSEGKRDLLALELEELEAEYQGIYSQCTAAKERCQELVKALATKKEEAQKRKEDYLEVQGELDKRREAMLATDEHINGLLTHRDGILHKVTDLEVKLKKIDQVISRFHKEMKDARKFIQHLEAKYSWIASEKQFFGQPHTDYDIHSRDPEEASKDLASLREEQLDLSKRINKKVMSMFEKAEQDYQDLIEKKRIIENDKAKIEKVIEELEEKKKEALLNAWQKVNQDFGSIFATLLPGANAKLEPPEGKTLLEGIQMQVSFGGAWKESLSELSGGQRSLLALSLILALLLFKPAPMYILDEIDAALDLSHTQNIGQMLKTHFSKSQFVIVSLKEELFKNANVLFKTKFIDGVSTVERTASKKSVRR